MSEQNVQVTQALADDGYTEHAKQILARVEREMDHFLPAKGETSQQCERRRLIEAIAEALAEQSLRHRTEETCKVCGNPNRSHHTHIAPFGEDYHPFEATPAMTAAWSHRTRAEPDLVEALRKCRDQFEFYVNAHMAKQPPDMDKAATNQEFVELCDAALTRAKKGG
jgi:hypothetical protein